MLRLLRQLPLSQPLLLLTQQLHPPLQPPLQPPMQLLLLQQPLPLTQYLRPSSKA